MASMVKIAGDHGRTTRVAPNGAGADTSGLAWGNTFSHSVGLRMVLPRPHLFFAARRARVGVETAGVTARPGVVTSHERGRNEFFTGGGYRRRARG